MGAGKSKEGAYYDPTFNSELFDQTRQCKFYRNHNGEQFQKYKVQNKGQSDFQNRYDYRIRNPSPYLVDAFSAKSARNAFGCTSGNDYQVVTQRIPTRLYDLNNLPANQALHITNSALKGFQQIYRSQGVMLVKDSMIGLNKQNRVKVWMNSNFALNNIDEPPISYGVLPQMQKQSTMVDNIIELVNSRSRKDQQWIQFVDDKYRQGRMGFDQAIKLTQSHSKRHNMVFSDYLQGGCLISNVNSQYGGPSHINQTQIRHSQQTFNPGYRQTQMSSTYHNIDHAPQVMKNTMMTGTSFSNNSIIPPNYTHQLQNNQIPQNRPTLQNQGTISNLKNKITGNGIPSNTIQSISNPVQPQILPLHQNINTPTNFPVQNVKPAILGINTQLPSIPQQQAPISIIKPVQPAQPVNLQNRMTFNSNQNVNSRPRAASEGKPIVNFGNKSFGSTPITPFPQMFNNRNQGPQYQNSQLPSPSLINNQLNQTKQNQINSTNLTQATTVNQNNSLTLQNGQINRYFFQAQQNLLNQNQGQTLKNQNQKVPLPIQLSSTQQNNQIQKVKQVKNIPQQLISKQIIVGQGQTIPYHQQQTVGSSVPSAYLSFQHNTIYQPPNKVVVYEKKNQATENRIQQNDKKLDNQPIITEQKRQIKNKEDNQEKVSISQNFQNIHKQNETNQPKIVQETQVYSIIAHNFAEKNQNTNRFQKAQTFGLNNVNNSMEQVSIYNSADEYNHTNEQKNIHGIDTPNFQRTRKQQSFGMTFNKTKLGDHYEEDQMLAHEQQHLNLIKSIKQNVKTQQNPSKSQQNPIKYLQQPKANYLHVKQVISVRQSAKVQEETDRQVNQAIVKLSNSVSKGNQLKQKQQVQVKQSPKQKQKDDAQFTRAVRQTASNIRMEASKISIRNSSDLKGIISYKDLRDLLKTSRKPTTAH